MEETSLCIRLFLSLFLLLPPLNSSWAQETDVAVLHVDPNRLQFFTYELIHFECQSLRGSAEWRVVKNTESEATAWEDSQTSMKIAPAFVTHSGEYWCENGEGERSSSVNISVVEANSVILESPVHPVMEGQSVTLRCKTKTPPFDLAADFYKDGGLERAGYKGKLTIHNVSQSDEGFYKCRISGFGESPESRLSVRAYTLLTTTHTVDGASLHPLDPGSNQLSVLLPIIFTTLFLAVLLLLLGLFHCHKHKVYKKVGGTDSRRGLKDVRGYQEMVMTHVTYTTVTPRRKKAKGETPDL